MYDTFIIVYRYYLKNPVRFCRVRQLGTLASRLDWATQNFQGPLEAPASWYVSCGWSIVASVVVYQG
jgi:hypothetical protein